MCFWGQLNYCVLLVFSWPLYKKFGAMLFVWSQYNFLLANIDIRTSVPQITHHHQLLEISQTLENISFQRFSYLEIEWSFSENHS